MSETRTIQIDVDDRGKQGRIAKITIDNQKKLNCIDITLIEKLIIAIEGFNDDPEIRMLILTGAGKRAFIGGVDINTMVSLDPPKAKEFITRLHMVCAAIRNLPVPVIARISGYCLGGGLEVAAACDLRVATQDSVFGMPEVKIGLPSVIEAALLPNLVGWGKARELIYTGLNMLAEEALSCGLVEKVVAVEELDQAITKWTDAILDTGPKSIRLQKELIREWEQLPVDKAIEKGIETFSKAYESDEPKSLMRSFLDRKS